MADRPACATPFASADSELLEPGPSFMRQGQWIDPAQQGYAVVHNYAAYFWRPYLGNTAFALWELLVSFCYGQRDVAFPSISRLARMLTNSDHSRAVVTGRRRRRASKSAAATPTQRTQGALELLRRERLVQVQRRGRGPTVRYTFRVLKALPLLRPEQLAQLSPQLQLDHANWLERYGIDEAAYRQAWDAPQDSADLEAFAYGAQDSSGPAAPGSTPAAQPSSGADSSPGSAAPGGTKHPHKDKPMEEWWHTTLDSLRLQMVKSVYHTYFTRTRPLSFKDGELTVQAAGPMQCEFLHARLAPLVLRELADASEGQVTGVRFVPPTTRDPVPPTTRDPVPPTTRDPVPPTMRDPVPPTTRDPAPRNRREHVPPTPSGDASLPQSREAAPCAR